MILCKKVSLDTKIQKKNEIKSKFELIFDKGGLCYDEYG